MNIDNSLKNRYDFHTIVKEIIETIVKLKQNSCDFMSLNTNFIQLSDICNATDFRSIELYLNAKIYYLNDKILFNFMNSSFCMYHKIFSENDISVVQYTIEFTMQDF
jgi:hypothetical protein